MKVIYMGTPEFAVDALRNIVDKGHEVVCVVTQPDKPKNRGKKLQPTPVKEAALELGIEVVQPEKVKDNEEFLEYIKEKDADIAVVAAYGQILPKEILEAPKYGCVNIHASLLPKLRGAAPIQRAILGGYMYSGVTLMKMDEGLDTGDMIAKTMISIGGMSGEELHNELMGIGAIMIADLLAKIENEGDDALKGEPQDHSQATYAHMVKKQEGIIDFNKPADEICRQINAFDPWPSAYTTYKGKTVKFKNPEWYGSVWREEQKECGTIVKVSKQGLVVQCKGDYLLINTIQAAGKRAMSIAEYIKGNELEEGVVLGQEVSE